MGRHHRTFTLSPMNRTLLIGCAFSATLCSPAQNIPNGGFEDWTNTGNYMDPTGWLTSNMVSFSVEGTLTCEQGSPGAVGAHFAKVTDQLLTGMGMQQASITIGVQGTFPGFPFTERPDALNGMWQYHPQGGAHDGVVSAALTRWNPVTHQRDVIANAPIHAVDAITSWESFSSPFLYYSEEYPDSAIVSVQASSVLAGDGTSLWVDALSFGQLQSVKEERAVAVEVWPSPATDQLRLRAAINITEVVVHDVSGRVMARTNPNRTEVVLPVATLPAGLYRATLRLADGRAVLRSFSKQ